MVKACIESTGNTFVKKLAALKTKKERDATGKFMFEGQNFVDEIPENWQVDCYVFSESFKAVFDISTYAARADVYILADHVFKKVSDTINPQGIMAVCYQKKAELYACLEKEDAFVLFGERITDPGNLGTVIRTAAAASCHGIVLSQGCVDVYNPKVLRAAAGGQFKIPIVEGVNVSEGLKKLSENGFKMVAAHVNAAVYPYDVDLRGKCCILIGNEANGLSDTACTLSHVHVKIPMSAQVESLNASVASGILLYEVVRQRISSSSR